MPIPKPIKNESQSKFISRCMSNSVMKEYEQKQRLAICYDTWRKSKRKRTTQETQEIIKWYEAKVKKGVPKKDGSGKGVGANQGRGECPKWVQMARRLLASKRGSPKLREYWKNRLIKYEASKK